MRLRRCSSFVVLGLTKNQELRATNIYPVPGPLTSCNSQHTKVILLSYHNFLRNIIKVRTSITLSKDLVEKIDSLAASYGNRSALIEKAVRDLIAAREKLDRDQNDLEIINKQTDTLNSEAMDVLSYQVDL